MSLLQLFNDEPSQNRSKTIAICAMLVLANALYLKAPWASEFSQNATQPEPFFDKQTKIYMVSMKPH